LSLKVKLVYISISDQTMKKKSNIDLYTVAMYKYP